MCTGHPKKGDLFAFGGLSNQEEEDYERACTAQLGSVLHYNKARAICFSKQLLQLADPHYVPSRPPPARAQKRKGTAQAQPQVPMQATEEETGEEATEEEPSTNLEDLAAFFQVNSEDEDEDN